MRHIKFTICLALLPLIVSGCSKESEPISRKPDAALSNVITMVRKSQVLMRGTEPMNSEFFDYNSDSKLDLFIGTTGHEYFDGDPMPIRQAGESSRRNLAVKNDSQQLSIHLNQTESNADSIVFGPSTGRDWVNRKGWVRDQSVPWG